MKSLRLISTFLFVSTTFSGLSAQAQELGLPIKPDLAQIEPLPFQLDQKVVFDSQAMRAGTRGGGSGLYCAFKIARNGDQISEVQSTGGGYSSLFYTYDFLRAFHMYEREILVGPYMLDRIILRLSQVSPLMAHHLLHYVEQYNYLADHLPRSLQKGQRLKDKTIGKYEWISVARADPTKKMKRSDVPEYWSPVTRVESENADSDLPKACRLSVQLEKPKTEQFVQVIKRQRRGNKVEMVYHPFLLNQLLRSGPIPTHVDHYGVNYSPGQRSWIIIHEFLREFEGRYDYDQSEEAQSARVARMNKYLHSLAFHYQDGFDEFQALWAKEGFAGNHMTTADYERLLRYKKILSKKGSLTRDELAQAEHAKWDMSDYDGDTLYFDRWLPWLYQQWTQN